jgi:hypothetical protein
VTQPAAALTGTGALSAIPGPAIAGTGNATVTARAAGTTTVTPQASGAATVTGTS